MVVLGIDPGYATVGFGAVDYDRGKFRVLQYGVIKTEPTLTLATRLKEIYNDLMGLIDHFKPDTIAVEELFFNTNVKTAIQVGHARGVILLAAAERGIVPYEYTPLQVKQAIVGYGRADKKQVMEMTKHFLGLKAIPRPDDAADALAIAVCHAHSVASMLKEG